jgi:hypothetical protein
MGMIWALCGLERNGIKRTRGRFGKIIPLCYRLEVTTKVFLEEERCVCDIGKKKEESMEASCTFICVMENILWVLMIICWCFSI